MKITTLILSFIFVVCVLSAPAVVIVQADEQTAPKFSVSFKMVNDTGIENRPGEYEKYSADENGTGTVIVSNAMVSLLVDNDGDEKYPKMTFKLDLDTNKTTDYYAVFYLDFNDGYGWFTFDAIKTDVYTLEEGYSPSEGLLYLDLYFISGYDEYDPMKINIKVEIYYTNGSLAATYGPDDDPDLKNIPVESGDYDEKKDPFITTPSPSPTPTPTPTVDEIKLNDSVLDGNRLTLRKGESIKVSAEALSGGEAISDAEIEAEADNRVVSVSPSVATTDENGLAEFTITAKKKGNAKVSFASGDATKILRVKVK